jgi:hypothetical protein
VGLAERALRFFLDPFVEAGEVVVVHALDLGDFLALEDAVEADGAALVCEADHLPLDPVAVGPRVLLPEEPLVGDAEARVGGVVEQRVVY